MQVKIVTLLNGQIIIGLDVSSQQEKVVLQKPAQIVSQQTQQGVAMGFVPYLDFTTEWTIGLPIDSEKIVHVTTPVPELLNEYNKAFGSGIEVISTMPSVLK